MEKGSSTRRPSYLPTESEVAEEVERERDYEGGRGDRGWKERKETQVTGTNLP